MGFHFGEASHARLAAALELPYSAARRSKVMLVAREIAEDAWQRGYNAGMDAGSQATIGWLNSSPVSGGVQVPAELNADDAPDE